MPASLRVHPSTSTRSDVDAPQTIAARVVGRPSVAGCNRCDDHARACRPHHHHQRHALRTNACERLVQRLTGLTRQHQERRRHSTMRHRNAGQLRRRHRRRHAGYDLERNTRVRERQRFLAPAEHERVAALEPDDPLALPRGANHQPVDRLLLHAGPAGALADAEALRVRSAPQAPQHRPARRTAPDQPLRRASARERSRARISGPCPDERHSYLRPSCSSTRPESSCLVQPIQRLQQHRPTASPSARHHVSTRAGPHRPPTSTRRDRRAATHRAPRAAAPQAPARGHRSKWRSSRQPAARRRPHRRWHCGGIVHRVHEQLPALGGSQHLAIDLWRRCRHDVPHPLDISRLERAPQSVTPG